MHRTMKKIRVSTLRDRKQAAEKIAAVTAYDTLTAAMAEAAGIDVVLVGDSLGMTALGFETTLSVTLDMMIHHAAAVARGASMPLLVVDMPFMTYKISVDQAMANAGRLMQEGNVEAVKVEGGAEMAEVVRRLVQAGVPVMGHIGLLPQSVHAMGGFRVQGRKKEDAERLLADAKALEEAGSFAIVLEGMPPGIASRITESISVPTIGIGAGADCDGQILVIADVLGMSNKKAPKFTRRYANLFEAASKGLEQYAADVKQGKFPEAEHFYGEV